MNPFYVNNANPNLNSYKDAESKFKAMNVVYTDASINTYGGQLYTDPNLTNPLTLTKAVEMMQSGLPIAANIKGNLRFAVGFDVTADYFGDDYEFVDAGIIFMDYVTTEDAPEGQPKSIMVPFYGLVNSDAESDHFNFQYGTRTGDGYREGYRGCNVDGFTLAFGMNTAAQKVIPNPFK